MEQSRTAWEVSHSLARLCLSPSSRSLQSRNMKSRRKIAGIDCTVLYTTWHLHDFKGEVVNRCRATVGSWANIMTRSSKIPVPPRTFLSSETNPTKQSFLHCITRSQHVLGGEKPPKKVTSPLFNCLNLKLNKQSSHVQPLWHPLKWDLMYNLRETFPKRCSSLGERKWKRKLERFKYYSALLFSFYTNLIRFRLGCKQTLNPANPKWVNVFTLFIKVIKMKPHMTGCLISIKGSEARLDYMEIKTILHKITVN